MDEFKDDSVTA